MYLRKFFLFLPFLIAAVLFKHDTTRANTEQRPGTLKMKYLNECDSFDKDLKQFRAILDQDPGIESIKKEYQTCRRSFKKVDFLIIYLAPDINKKFNGPNLPYLDKDPVTRNVFPGQGFQTMEELIYNKDTVNIPLLKQQLNMLLVLNRDWKDYIKRAPISHSIWIAAIRSALISIFTTGLTGFESPLSLQSIRESTIELAAIRDYFVQLSQKYPVSRDDIRKQFTDALAFMYHNEDFNSFDRLEFYKKDIQPLYAALIDWQKASRIEFVYEYSFFVSSVNDTVKQMFSENFLNPQYYSYDNKRKTKDQNLGMAKLGKLLFFDPVLSLNQDRSCNTCHKPEAAFAEHKTVSSGIHNPLKRNAPGLYFSSLQDKQFWDARAGFLEEQPEHVILNPEEFAAGYILICSRLQKSRNYRLLFKQVFPNDETPITGININRALAAFLRTLISFNSPFDQYVRGEIPDMNEDAKAGFNLFMGKAKCGTCHFAPVFNGTVPPGYDETETEILGVTASEDFLHPKLDNDPGRSSISHVSIHSRSFKTPTVRNSGFTAPYMHNGMFAHIDSLLVFYNYGGGAGMGLDVPFQTLPSDSLKLNEKELMQLAAFLQSLNDSTILQKKYDKWN